MSAPPDSPAAGRGAEKRRALRQARSRESALHWWTRPGVLIFLGALALASVGWGLLVHSVRKLPVEEASIDGLDVRLDDARWILDQMEHGDNFAKPAAMMPDLPMAGSQRVTAYLALGNRTNEVREFHGEEFFLVPEIGEELPPIGAVLGEAQLAPGQKLNTALHFDLDTRKPYGKLLMQWRRGDKSAYFAIPEPSEHYHLRPRKDEVALPTDARLLLPISNPDRGEDLYAKVYGCGACHGDPQVLGSNNLGPHLGNIGREAAERVRGVQGPQYLYESFIDPNAFIAPDCKGTPCQSPSAMPDYSTLVNLQDAADLLSYLLQLQAPAAQTATAGEEKVKATR
jgi:hypothetical protein